MPRRRGAFGAARGRVGPRRETLWVGGPDETSVTVVLASGVDLQSSASAALLAMRPFTVVRTRGLVYVRSDQTANTETPFGAFGLAVVSEQASAIGVTAVPTPITDESSDLWFLYQFVATGLQVSSAVGIPGPANVYEFDSKAMRKVEDGQDVISVFENGSSADGLSYIAKFRFLIKLH